MQPIMSNISAGPSKGGNEFIDVDEALEGNFDVRRVELRPLPARVETSIGQDEEGFVPLFDGKTLDGWVLKKKTGAAWIAASLNSG